MIQCWQFSLFYGVFFFSGYQLKTVKIILVHSIAHHVILGLVFDLNIISLFSSLSLSLSLYFFLPPSLSSSQVMLLSLQAGGVGLTLTGANHVFITDLHWWAWHKND